MTQLSKDMNKANCRFLGTNRKFFLNTKTLGIGLITSGKKQIDIKTTVHLK
jgi:hypothetical protein